MTDDAIDRLFDLPLDAFVSARNQLAAELKRTGDRDGSEAVNKLAKPAVGAWAINQLARKHPDEAQRFLRSTDRLLRAQMRGMSSDTVDPDFQPAVEEQRSALGAMLKRAEALLQEGGHGTTRAMIERIAATLRAAVLDEAARRLLETGRMIEEKGDAGFDALAAQLGGGALLGSIAPAPSAKPAAPVSPAKKAQKEAPPAQPLRGVDASKKAIAAAREEVENLRREETAAKESLRFMERKMIEARNAHDQAKQALGRARRALEQAERAVEQEETKVGRLDKEREEAEAAVETARAGLKEIATRIKDANDALQQARGRG